MFDAGRREFRIGDLVWVTVREQRMFPHPVKIEKIYEHEGEKGYFVASEATGFTVDHLTLATEQAPPPSAEGGAGVDNDIAKDFEAAPAAAAATNKPAAAASPRLEPDRVQIGMFVDALFRYAGDKGFVAVRSFYEGADKPFRLSTAKLSGGLQFLVDVAEDDARRAAQNPAPVVFCPPIAVFTGKDRAREEGVALGVVMSVECDAHPQQARATLERLLGHATIVVESGGVWTDPDTGKSESRLHLHWRLKHPARGKDELAKLKTVRGLAAKLVGADLSCVPLSHPMRWPGSWHRKAEPRLAEIISAFDTEIDLNEALSLLCDAAGVVAFAAGASGQKQDGAGKGGFDSGNLGEWIRGARFLAPNVAAVVSALAAIPNEDRDWVDWNKLGMATWAATGGSEAGGEAFAAWSAKSPKNNPQTTSERWRHYATSPPTKLGFGSLVYWARHYSPGWAYAGPDGEKSGTEQAVDDEGEEGPAVDALGADEVDRLVEKTATDPGAAFAPEMCKRLAALKASDYAAFETLRARLKKAGCRVAELDKLITAARVKGAAEKEPAEGGDGAKGKVPPGPDRDIRRLNEVHAVLPIGGKTRVVKFGELEEFPDRETIVMTQTVDDFRLLNNKYRHCWINKKGEQKSIPLGDYWIGSPYRRQFDGGMVFAPQHDGDPGNRLNLWGGFGVNAVKPDGTGGEAGCREFLDFMRDVICSGNEEHFDYLRKREATIFQKRIRSEVALGLRTIEEGCGKGFYEGALGRLLGNHAMQVTNPRHIIGNFNPHLETLLRLTADEALFVGNPEHRNALFGLITEPTLTIEPKGCGLYKADSYLNLSIVSNADHFLPVSGTARRFFIPTVSASRRGDFAYFAGLKAELEGGGYEALLYHLLHEVDLTDFNVRKVPQTAALIEQRDHSLPPLDMWWSELLETGTLWGADPREPHRAVSNAYHRLVKVELNSRYDATSNQVRHVRQLGIYDQAREIEPRLRKNYTSDHRLGHFLSEMGCVSTKVLQRRGWAFPPLSECRGAWVKRYPNWVWRNPEIANWTAEESEEEEADEATGDR